MAHAHIRTTETINGAEAAHSWKEEAANANGSEAQALRAPTRELQLNADLLCAWLESPAGKLSRDERLEMELRLGAMRDELARRTRQAHKAQQASRSAGARGNQDRQQRRKTH